MRRLMIGLLLSLNMVLLSTSAARPVHAQSEVCQVPANFLEAWEENSLSLLKVMALIRSNESPLQRDSGFSSYYMMLISTRHYHEAQHSALPTCAHELNESLIRTISASQDVLALTMAWQQNPDVGRYQARHEQASNHLDKQWLELIALRQATMLTYSQ